MLMDRVYLHIPISCSIRYCQGYGMPGTNGLEGSPGPKGSVGKVMYPLKSKLLPDETDMTNIGFPEPIGTN